MADVLLSVLLFFLVLVNVLRASSAGGLHRLGVGPSTSPCTLQSYLLDLANYISTLGTTGTIGREFSVSCAFACYGARVKIRTSPAATTNLRVYRASDQSLVASKDNITIAPGEQILLFDAPVELAAGTYRIATYDVGTVNLTMWATGDHPDGPVVTLTGNTMVWVTASDSYPGDHVDAWSMAIEPIVCAHV